MTPGIIIAALDLSEVSEAQFYDWLQSNRSAAHQLPNVIALTRWVSIANARQAVVVWELDDLDRFRGPAADVGNELLAFPRDAGELRYLLHFEGDLLSSAVLEPPSGAGGLLLNAMSVDPAHEAEFNDWYDAEHIPTLSAVTGTLCARRFRARTGSPRYLALYHLASPDVQASPEWKRAANTPWTEAMRPRFRDHVRIAAASAG